MKVRFLLLFLSFSLSISFTKAQAPPPVRDTVLHIGICGGIDTTWVCPYFEEGVQYRWEPLNEPPLQDFIGHEVGILAENLTENIISYEYYMNRTYVDELGNFLGSFTDTIIFDVYPEPNAFVPISDFSLCPGDTGLMYYDVISEGTYLFTNPSSSTFLDTSNSPLLNLFPTEPTAYDLYYTNAGGCLRGPFSILVNVGPPPPVLESNLPPIVCNNSDGVKLKNYVNPSTGTFSGAGVVADTAFFPNLSGLGTHPIEYTIIHLNCPFSILDTISVIAPGNISMTPLPNFCLNEPRLELNVGVPSGGSYSGPGVSFNNFTPSDAGVGPHQITYSVEFDEFCVAEVSQTITVIPIPAEPIITINPEGNTILCNNELVTLTSSEAGSYFWQPTLATTQSIVVTLPGQYYVQVINAAGCSNYSDTLEFQIGESPEITLLEATIYSNGFNTSAFGEEDGQIDLEVSGGLLPYSYQWSNGSSNEDIIDLAPGTYSVVISDSAGCSTNGELVLIGPDSTIGPPLPNDGKPFGLPNAFTPNNDGYNDLYVITGLEPMFIKNRFRVWDESRQLVFEADDYNNTWDGTDLNGNRLGAATYFGVFESDALEKPIRTYINIRYE